MGVLLPLSSARNHNDFDKGAGHPINVGLMVVKSAAKKLYRSTMAVLKRSAVDMKRPVFIWGHGQSGTFLLYDLLAACSTFCYPHAKGWRKKGLVDREHYKDYGVAKFLDRNTPVEGIANWILAGCPVELYGFPTSCASLGVDAKKVYRNYQNVQTCFVLSNSPKRRFMDKSPMFMDIICLVDEIFPDAYHIFIIRDPRAILNSTVKRFRSSGPDRFIGYDLGFYGNIFPSGYEEYLTASLVKKLSWQIDTRIRHGLSYAAGLDQNRIKIVYHEKIIENMRNEIFGILDFVDGNINEDAIATVPEAVKLKTFRWPREGDPWEPEIFSLSWGEAAEAQETYDLSMELGYDWDVVCRLRERKF